MTSRYTLEKTFTHKTTTHECCIQWTRIGNIDGPPLIFIHGTPWSNVVWHDVAAALSSRYSIYLYDHPGFGNSPALKRLPDAERDDKVDLDGPLILRAEASAALFKHWNLTRPPHIVGHDNGGLTSLRLLLQHDIKFASLCLIDVVTSGHSKLAFFQLVTDNQDVFKATPPHLFEGFVRGYVRGATFKLMPREIEDMLCAPWLPEGTQGTDGFIREMLQAQERDASDIEGQYAGVGSRLPVKIIWGKDDTWLPAHMAPKLKNTLNAEELIFVEDAGHLIHYDQPSKVALEVGLWLSKNTGQ